MPSASTTPSLSSEPKSNAALKAEARSPRAILTVWMSQTLKAHLCFLPLQKGEEAEARQADLILDGSVPPKKIKEALRELGWRGQRENPCFVVIPSEDVLLLIQEFPTRDPDEARIMAEGWMQGMVELDQNEHILLIHELHRSQSSTVCALAVFARDRLQRIFENVQKLGITNPHFVLDIVGLWQVSGEVIENGFWGHILKDESKNLLIVKGLKIVDGVVRTVRQRIYYREQVDEAWIQTLAAELFPEEFREGNEHGMTWRISHRSAEAPSHLIDVTHLAAEERLVHFEPQPGFWKEHLRRQHKRKAMITTACGAVGCYLLFILYLITASILQWHESKKLNHLYQSQEPAYRKAMDTKTELAAVRASLNPSGNALEVLRQVVEAMPEGIVINYYNYRFQDTVQFSGIAVQDTLVNTFASELQKNSLFKGATIGSNNRDSQTGKFTWDIKIPLKGL